MKKLLVLMALFSIVLAGIALAESIAVVVEMPDDTVKKECVWVEKDTNGYDTLEKTKMSFTWSSSGVYGHALCKVEGEGDEVAGSACNWSDEYWGFFTYNGGWTLSNVGFDAPGSCSMHYCAEDGDMIGLARVSTNANSTFYNNEPPVIDFGNVCGLAITDIDVKVDGDKDSNLDDGDTIGEKAKPGSSVEFRVEVSNLFSDDIEINDVTVTITIYDIDDGDELEEEANEFDLKDGKDKTAELNFKVPLIVDEDDYTVLIEVEGDGDDGITYRDEAELTLRVKKDRHNVDITEFKVVPAALKCNRKTAATIEIINLGRNDEDEVAFEIRNDELGILIKQQDIELEEGDKDDSVFRESFYLDLEDAEPGIYTITAKSFYDNTKEEDIETTEIVIEKCGVEVEEEEEVEVEKEEEEEVTAMVVTQPVTEYKYAKPKEGVGTTVVLLALAIVVVVVLIALLLSVLFKRR